MAIVDLLDAEEYSEEVHRYDERLREYTGAPGMTPYAKAAGRYPPLLDQMGTEHRHVMLEGELPRELKELVAVAVSMVNNCSYCVAVHTKLQKQLFDRPDSELVELVGVAAHFTGVNRFDAVTHADGDPLFEAVGDADGLLAEIEETLGVVPRYYRVMARDPEYAAEVWKRERAVMQQGTLDPLDKEFVAFGVSVANSSGYGARLHRDRLVDRGATQGAVFEALEVAEIFQKNNVYTSGLQLRPGIWDDQG